MTRIIDTFIKIQPNQQCPVKKAFKVSSSIIFVIPYLCPIRCYAYYSTLVVSQIHTFSCIVQDVSVLLLYLDRKKTKWECLEVEQKIYVDLLLH